MGIDGTLRADVTKAMLDVASSESSSLELLWQIAECMAEELIVCEPT